MWLQWDWGDGPRIGGRRTQLFCAWLAWSRFRVVIPVRDQQAGTLTWCIDQALRAVGGAPAYLLTDNARTVTMDHVAGIPVRHPQMVTLGRHYGCTVATCVPFDPESKGGVEATVKIAKADLVPSQANLRPAYGSFAGLQDACRQFCAQVNGRVHRETAAVPAGQLAAEREHLHPLPDQPYALALGEERLVGEDQTIRFGSVRYSTPPGHVGTRVWCRAAGEELVITAATATGAAEIARHRLSVPGSPADPRRALPAPSRPERAAAAPAPAPHRGRDGVPGHRRRRAPVAHRGCRLRRAADPVEDGPRGRTRGRRRQRPGGRGPGPGGDRWPVRRRRPGLDHRPPGRRAGGRGGGDRRRGALGPARHRRLGPPGHPGGRTVTPRRRHEDALVAAEAAAVIRRTLVACSKLLDWAEGNSGPQFRDGVARASQAAGLSRSPSGPGPRHQPIHRLPRLLPLGLEEPVTGPAAPPLPAELDALLRRMRLPHLRKAAPDVLATARAQRWEPAEVLRVLIAEEVAGRDAATRRLRRKTAGFPTGKTFSSWRPEESSVPAATQDALATLEWIGRAENLVVAGPSGTGKSHLAEALAHAAIEKNLRVAWFTLETLTAAIAKAKADGSVARTVTRICRADLIVVDDIGMLPAGQDAAEAFYRITDAAYERRSVAVTSNIHPSGFDSIMPKTLATATVDRVLHHAHLVQTKGDSHRLAEALAGK